ncbi:hypothetical protein MXMO3_03580 (plasmid) [Maritalea myrionectae]|uniref:Uncharacterized protein n=1 Tax=Maritalea myrionectae TaxID=454601 RepID=A0A2R4MJB7_9HYPH|nr:hypothetical protein MXMO3_03580 [Maritalea myrionectae]
MKATLNSERPCFRSKQSSGEARKQLRPLIVALDLYLSKGFAEGQLRGIQIKHTNVCFWDVANAQHIRAHTIVERRKCFQNTAYNCA